jgi:hypothetical protein
MTDSLDLGTVSRIGSPVASRVPSALPTPSTDLGDLTEILGQAWGVSCGKSLTQYLAWCDGAGLFSLAARYPVVSLDDFRTHTALSDEGIDALVVILASVGLLRRRHDGRYLLSEVAREYFVTDSPFYVGESLYLGCTKQLPELFLRESHDLAPAVSEAPWSTAQRLRIQHGRNFAAGVAAARSGQFTNVRHVVDMCGGTGTFAIPLALDQPNTRITLVDLPETIQELPPILSRYGVEDRIELVAMDVFGEWTLPSCDCIVFGNLFHSCSDDECRHLVKKSWALIAPGGRFLLHEVVLNDHRDGPLLAALWNANMLLRRTGARQRTRGELASLVEPVGFTYRSTVPTLSRYSLLRFDRPLATA